MINKIKNIDNKVTAFFDEKLSNDFLDKAMKIITFLGDYAIIWILVILYLFQKQKTTEAMAMIGSLCITSLINERVLKKIFKRARPAHTSNFKKTITKIPSSYSFPSGHTATAFSVVPLAFMSYSTAMGLFSIIIASIIGFSRIYIKVHYLSDVVIGASFGTLISVLTYTYIF